ncbi:MAG: hypothetical protein M1832_005150 [Thelocarpon impressellum]|nr:MAG: hypothetical protein M1832_005150 [Thelocarpon impressellum]
MVRRILLAGAPLSSALDWAEEALSKDLLPAFRGDVDSRSAETRPAWRIIPLQKTHLPTGLTQRNAPSAPQKDQRAAACVAQREASLCSGEGYRGDDEHTPTAPPSATEEAEGEGHEETRAQFYEHSLSIHDSFTSSTTSSYTSTSSANPLSDPLQALPPTGPLTPLSALPSASHLTSLLPQTLTRNLIVGLISLPPARLIKTRYGGHSMELVELLVGDASRAGVGVNIWLSPDSPTSPRDPLRASLEALRPRDVVLARNVALGSFGGRVYGQSLRRGLTTLHLLYREKVERGDVGGLFRRRDLFPEAEDGEVDGGVDDELVARVRGAVRWVERFVPPIVPRPAAEGGGGWKDEERLPADTQ